MIKFKFNKVLLFFTLTSLLGISNLFANTTGVLNKLKPIILSSTSTLFTNTPVPLQTLNGKFILTMFDLPDKQEPYHGSNEIQQIKLKKLIDDARIDIASTFNLRFLPLDQTTALIPLDQKVSGQDSLGVPFDSSIGIGYLRRTQTHYYLFLIPNNSILTTVTKEEISEPNTSQLSTMSSIDQKRIDFSNRIITEFTRFSQITEHNKYLIQRTPAQAIITEETKALSNLDAFQEELKNKALSAIFLIYKDKLYPRLHWRYLNMGNGLYGETIISHPPPPTPDYLQDVNKGSILRFYIDNKILIICQSTNQDVYKEIPKQFPSQNISGTWFTQK